MRHEDQDIVYTPWKIFIWAISIAVIIVGSVAGVAMSAKSEASSASQSIEAHKEMNQVQFDDIKASLTRIEKKIDNVK